ncbi:DUF2339 domain-containing protein [Legionella spiritensis]|uniref:DUF2339 domain-containing protein n=1 Tax=Legionella spiritensis TaxID=452 RepID=A0A0W0YYH0_LEGSP|nr:DUF2339 domain-containing protein [Legionella spiritensis]KTD61937.1 hypothetical protein Lspi_2567 [Legionella spiritensis]SNV31012.1 Predicted membrane protein [Legionella spiritensis]
MNLATLQARLEAMEDRLAIIEKKLSLSEPVGQPVADKAWIPASDPLPSAIHPETKPQKTRIDNLSGSGNWLAIIAVICFVLAAGFIIKLSIETGWLTPERQVGIAVLLGLTLTGAGFVLRKTYGGYASYLPAAGIVILYLSVFAAHRIYTLLTLHSALTLAVLVSVFCVGVYVKFRQDIYAITAVVGTYLAPVILDFPLTSLFSLYFFLCCSLAFAVLSVGVSSRVMCVIAAYLAIFINAMIGLRLHQDVLIAIVLAAHFLIFSISVYGYTLYNRQQLTEGEAWSFFPVLMLFYAMEYFFIDRIHPGLAPWLSLLFAGLLIALYFSAKKWFPGGRIKSQSMILTFASVVFFHSFYLELLPANLKPWLLVLILFAGVLFPVEWFKRNKTSTFYFPILLLAIIVMTEYVNIVAHLLNTGQPSWLPVGMFAFAGIWSLFIRHRREIVKEEEYGFMFLGAAHVLAVSGLYRLADPYGSFAVSVCWLLYAIAVMGFAGYLKDKVLAKSALFVLGFAAGKALLYDAASTPTVVRILCLLLTGVVLYGAGLLMKRIERWA